MKEETQKFACHTKICLMHKHNTEQSEKIKKNLSDMVQTISELTELLTDFIDGSLTFGNEFALVHTERSDYNLHESSKSQFVLL